MQLNTTSANTGRSRPARSFALGVIATVAAGIACSAALVGAAVPAAKVVEPSTFVPITPCRLMDTRPGDGNVGLRDTPLGENEIHVQQVAGQNGDCTVPAGITAVALNATAIRPTARTFLTFFPSDASLPNASNLNTTAGQPPTPNKVDVRVGDSGAISIFNAFGEVHLAVDVVGYYTALALPPAPFATTAHSDGGTLDGAPSTVVMAEVEAAAAGAVVVDSTAVFGSLGGGRVDCQINDAVAIDNDHRQTLVLSAGEGGSLSGTRTFPVDAGETILVHLVCAEASGMIGVDEADLTAVFIPSFVAQDVASQAS